MFSSLLQTTDLTPIDSSMQEFDDVVLENLELEAELHELRQEVRSTMTTIDELNSLHSCIKSYGLSVALLQFANVNNVLSQAIPEIPSLESMNVDATDENAALEGILRTIGDLIGGIAAKIKAFGAKILSSIKLWYQSTAELQKQTAHYKAMVEGKEFDATTFNSLTSKLVPYAQLIELIDLGPANMALTLDIMKLKLPETNPDREVWLAAYHSLNTKHLGNFSIVRNERVQKPRPTSMTYAAAGYTEAAFDEIVKHLEAFAEDEMHNFSNLCDEFERYEEYVERRLDELTETSTSRGTTTKYNPETGRPDSSYGSNTVKTKSEGAKILDYTYTLAGEHYLRNNNISWKDGARGGLRVLSGMVKAYK